MVLPLLFGALAPGLLPGMSPVLAASLGAGVGGAVQTGDLEKGLLTGLGAFAGGSLLGPMLGGAGNAGAQAAQTAQAAGAASPAVAKAAEAASTVASANAAANPAAAATAAATSPTATPGGLTSLFRGPAPGSTASILGTPSSAAGAAGGRGILGNAMDFSKSPTGMGVGIGAMAGQQLSPLLGGMSKGGSSSNKSRGSVAGKEMRPIPENIRTPPSDYRHGIDPEFDYGISGVPSAGQIIDFRDRGIRPMSDGGLLRRYQAMMGPVRMAGGGIVTLAETADEQTAPVGGNEKDVVVGAVEAIKGQSTNPEIALAMFVRTYGEDALRDLVDRVQSGEFDQNMQGSSNTMHGPGDGMDDMIPASVEGQQDVLLSDGEFVVPADVVSGIGNGSTNAGSRALEEMMARVRAARTGSPDQPPRLAKREMMPG